MANYPTSMFFKKVYICLFKFKIVPKVSQAVDSNLEGKKKILRMTELKSGGFGS